MGRILYNSMRKCSAFVLSICSVHMRFGSSFSCQGASAGLMVFAGAARWRSVLPVYLEWVLHIKTFGLLHSLGLGRGYLRTVHCCLRCGMNGSQTSSSARS